MEIHKLMQGIKRAIQSNENHNIQKMCEMTELNTVQKKPGDLYKVIEELLTETEDILNRWRRYYEKLCELKFEISTGHWQQTSSSLEPDITVSKVKNTIKCLKLSRSPPGYDGIPAEFIKNTGSKGT